MPAYLSDGSRQYNQMRRINPRDPASKLGYYLSEAECSSTARSSTRTSRSRVHPGEADSSSSFYSNTISKILGRRPRGAGQSDSSRAGSPWSVNSLLDRLSSNQVRQRRKQRLADRPTAGSSPDSCSVQGTLAEVTTSEHFAKPSYQIDLLEANPRSGDPKRGSQRNYQIQQASKSFADSLESTPLELQPGGRLNSLGRGRPIGVGQANVNRLKRRNLSRLNRRMLVGSVDGHLVNSYALSELFSQSEIPGFREIFASDSYLRKFCWIVAFLFMTVLSLNDMTELITEYYDYPITVDVRLRDSSRLPFPSVTVCNLNVVRFSALCSSTSSSRLTNQIPSELRDKLCGIQVEKKNSSRPDDIGDINNIGITTKSTPAPTTPSSPKPTELASTTPIALTTQIGGPRPEETAIVNRSQSNADQTGTTSGPSPPSSTGGAEHKLVSLAAPSSVSGSPVTANPSGGQSSTRRRSTASGALDLGDFAEPPALLQQDRRQQRRRSRSIRLEELGPGAEPPRPFTSGRAHLRVRPVSPPDHQEAQYQFKQQSASQTNKQGVNLLPSGNRTPNGQRGGPATVGFQNPLLPVSTASSPPLLSTSTFAPPALPEDYELTERQERELQENLTNWLAVMNNRDPQLTWSLGHQFDDMILRCTMKSINCTHQRSFENSFSPTEGNCYTYRSKIRRRNRWPATERQPGRHQAEFEDANLAGTNHGLELVLNLEKNEYISGSSQVGALVMIHHPSDLGYAASEATFVAPEFTTYIGLKMVNITRLPAPYPEYCVDSWPAKFADTLTRNSTYSQQACLRICLQKTIQTHCQCQSAFLPIVELEAPLPVASQPASSPPETRPPTEPRIIICDTRKLATRQCVREVMFRAADRVHNCECPPKCQVVRYDKTISMARWPTREDKVSFDRGKMDVNFQNLAKVIVYFQTMTCEEVSQQAVFNAAKLFSALGGVMGMYVGFSFLSVFEIFEVMSRKMWHHFMSKLRHIPPTARP